MSDPAAAAVVAQMEHPLARAAALILSAALAAGYGADAAVTRAGVSEIAMRGAIADAVRPLADELEDGRRERRRLARAVDELLDFARRRDGGSAKAAP